MYEMMFEVLLDAAEHEIIEMERENLHCATKAINGDDVRSNVNCLQLPNLCARDQFAGIGVTFKPSHAVPYSVGTPRQRCAPESSGVANYSELSSDGILNITMF